MRVWRGLGRRKSSAASTTFNPAKPRWYRTKRCAAASQRVWRMPENKLYRFDPGAWLELEAAADWYLQRSPEASIRFLAAVNDALEMIVQWPQRWPKWVHGSRRFILRRFPFSIVYLDEPAVVSIVAVAHSKRKPGYWKARL